MMLKRLSVGDFCSTAACSSMSMTRTTSVEHVRNYKRSTQQAAAESFLPQKQTNSSNLMKRVAESQLTKDGGEDNSDDSQDIPKDFQKADPATLSARRIRGLPKRASMAGTPPGMPTSLASNNAPSPSTDDAAEEGKQSAERASRFGTFTGFGGSVPSAFTFTPPALKTSSIVPQAFPAPAGSLFSAAQPPSQPNKGFSFTSTSKPPPPNIPPVASDGMTKQDPTYKYCLSLRGLNSSFVDAVTKALKSDPFVNITEMLENYKSLRLSIQAEFDKNSPVSGSNQGKVATAPPPTPLPSNPIPSMPVPPKSAFSFAVDTRATPPAPQGAGFTPKMDRQPGDLPSSPFPWPSKTPASGTPEKTPASQLFVFGNKDSAPKIPVTFGTPTSTATPTPFASPSFTFNVDKRASGPAESKVASDPVKPSEDKETQKEKSSTPPGFTFKPSALATPLTPGFSSFLSPPKPSDAADDSPTRPSTTLGSSNLSSPSPSGFGFGAGKSLGASNPFGSFGKGSIGNPVGFAFGSPPTASITEPSGSTTVTKSDAPQEAGLDTNERSSLVPSHDPSPAPSQGSAYDGDGPGEEDEVTLHESKARAYRMTSTGDTRGWVSAGSGQLKLKGRVGVVKRRILMRNSSTGQVILNFNLFPGFQVTSDKKSISFRVPGKDEAAAVYQVRVPNEADATNWQETILKHVDELVPSPDT